MKIENQLENIYLISEKTRYTGEEIKSLFPNKKIFICDFALSDLDEAILAGQEIDRIGPCFMWQNMICVDHHAPHPTMSQNISSVNLAFELRKNHPEIFTDDFVVVINHTDTDSILSALMTAGIWPPDERWVKAGLAADHTGANNEIKSLLQAIQNDRDLDLSLKNLKKHLTGKKIDKKVEASLAKYHQQIFEVQELIKAGIFKQSGMISYALMDKNYDFVNFVGLMPEAAVLMMLYPKKNSEKLGVKIRLGRSAPDWLKLNKLKFEGEDDFGFGCRWNAGSNGRSEGTSKKPEEIITIVNRAIEQLRAKEL